MTARNKIDESKLQEVLNAVKKGEDGSRIKLEQLTFSKLGVDEEMIRRFGEQVEKGDSEAMWKLGLCKEYGLGTKQSVREAESLHEESSDCGNPIGIILAVDHPERGLNDNSEEQSEAEEEDDDDEEEDEYDEEYDESFDDYADDVLDRIDFISTAKAGWSRPMKGVNVSKVKNCY